VAFLNRFARALAATALLASCNGESEVGGIEVDLYEGEVDCDETSLCRDLYGEDASYERLHGFAFLTTETSAHHPDGLYVYFEVVRQDGTLGRGEIDVALDGDGEHTVLYTETRSSEVVFVAAEAAGVVEVPEEAWGEECDCLDGRLELVLRDASGATRRLSRGRFGWEDRPCVERARFTDLDEELVVIPRTCRASVVPGTTYDPPTRDTYDSPPSYDYYDGGGCDGSACSGTAGSSASCGGGASSGCDSGGGSGCEGGGGGCEGDVGGAGGCGGDVGGGGGCAGDTGGCRVVGRPRRVGPRGPLQTGLLIAAALAWVIRPRRYR